MKSVFDRVYMMFRLSVDIILVFSLLFEQSFAPNLEATLLDVKFSSARYDLVAVYDGQDSIYTWGGIDDVYNWNREILKYSISSQTLQLIGTIKQDVGDYGSGVWTGNDDLLHFGGRNPNTGGSFPEIYNFKTDNADSNWSLVSNLPNGCYNCAGVWDKEENTYIIGGSRSFDSPLNTISRYSSVSNHTHIVAYLSSPRSYTSAIFDDDTGTIYIFGGFTGTTVLNDILRYDPRHGSVTKLSAVLPVAIDSSCTVWSGKEAYIIGGYTDAGGDIPHIVRFNPSTNEITSLFITNFPDKIYGIGCVFVQKLNRIYILGGRDTFGRNRDQFMYIDLGPIGTTTTETPPETTSYIPIEFECPTEEGLYPDPKNCRGFYNCADWFPYHFCCPLPLFFNPSEDRCDFQDTVECHNDPTLPCDSPPGLGPYTRRT